MNNKCIHDFKWYGYDTSKCEKCGLVLSDEEADKIREEQQKQPKEA